MEKIIGFVIILLLSALVIFDTGEIEMKKITSFIIVLLLSIVAVFAVPKKFCDKVYDDEVLTCWLNDTEYPVWTSNLSLEEQLEDLDYKFYSDIEETDNDLVYLIAKYDYILIRGTNYYIIETELDGKYVAYEIGVEE